MIKSRPVNRRQTDSISKYLKQAGQLRQIAEDVRGREGRQFLLDVARDYERMAGASNARPKGGKL
jgi:hypothetical protein